MATIYERINKDGTKSFRVQIRRKGLKQFSAHFLTRKDAKRFVEQNEHKYCLNPDGFLFDHLKQSRLNEFSRKK